MSTTNDIRVRFRKRQAEEQDVPFTLGVAQANAYFNARRITQQRRGKIQKKSKSTNKKSDGEEEPEEHDDEKEEMETRWTSPAHGELLEALKHVDEREQERRKKELPAYDEAFPQWRSELLAGYNLLIYGMGSKVKLLQRFAEEYLDDGVVVQVHGYLPSVSIRYLSKFLHTEVLKVNVKASRSVLQQCQDIAKFAKKNPITLSLPRVYLLVHSIDGMIMRTQEIQSCLSWLATASFIHIIASMDHINGISLWKEEDTLRFQWISQTVNTFIPYTDEIELRLTRHSKTTDQSRSGIKFILQSLTPTDVSTLQIIARHQLAATTSTTSIRRKKQSDSRADYQTVYEECRKKLLHSTLLAMKNSITCLEDHGLVKRMRVQNVEKLEIPLPVELIRAEILQQMDAPTIGGK